MAPNSVAKVSNNAGAVSGDTQVKTADVPLVRAINHRKIAACSVAAQTSRPRAAAPFVQGHQPASGVMMPACRVLLMIWDSASTYA